MKKILLLFAVLFPPIFVFAQIEKGKMEDPQLQFIPNFDKIEAGEMLELEVWIGSEFSPIANLYAIAFETYFNTNLIDGNSISMDYSGSSLGIVGVDLLTTGWINEANGRINVSMSKTNGAGKSGRLYLLTIRMNTNNLISPENFSFHITDFGATDPHGNELFINVNDTPTIRIEPNVVGIEDKVTDSKPYSLYPSFTQNGFYLDYLLQQSPNVKIMLFDLSGQKIGVLLHQTERSLGQFQQYIDLKEKHLATGMYIVEVEIDGKKLQEKLVFY